jgi:predicted HD phosphohydrolase
MKNMTALLILTLLFFGCGKDQDIVNPPPAAESQITIKVDPRMELLSVIQHFTSWSANGHIKPDVQYKEDIDNYFKGFEKSAAVKKSEQLLTNGFGYDVPAEFILYHSDPPYFKQIIPYSNHLINLAGSESILKDYADAIRDFAVKSNFMDFYNSHQGFYEEIKNEAKKAVGNEDYIMGLEYYYGEKKNSYTIILVPLFACNYGIQVESSMGRNIYCILGTMNTLNNQPSYDDDWIIYNLLHEFSHSFVNPVTAKYSSEIDKSKSLFEPIKTAMVQQAYMTWETCVNEHLVRTNVARFALQGGKTYHDQIIQFELNYGFIYITNLDSLMEKYENNRGTYGTYENFYPEIIKLFDSLVKP